MIPLSFLAPVAIAEPAPPAPSITLTVAQESADRWRMRVENTGTVPVFLAADARLLSFDVTAPDAKKPVRCTLPADLRPSGAESHALVLPPQRAYAEVFDPRMYCFGAKEEAALVPGATVVAHLGWPAPAHARKLTGPFEVEPIEGVAPLIAAAKEIASAPWTVANVTPTPAPTPAPAPTPTPTPTPALTSTPSSPLEVSSSPRVDVETGREAHVTVTVANKSPRSATLLVGVETIAFDVDGPAGPVRCGGLRVVDAPIRELYSTLAPGGRTSVDVLLSEVCPDRAFDQPGLYVVRPELDTRRASGAPIGLRTWDGIARSSNETRIRVRTTRKPTPLRRPALE